MPFGIGGKEVCSVAEMIMDGSCISALDTRELFWVVNQFFGGEGHMPEDEPVCFTKM